TEEIRQRLKNGDLDIGILATPLNDAALAEHVLFYEEFMMYASEHENLPRKKFYVPKDINLDHLWLLQEGHCLRSQVLNLCMLKEEMNKSDNLSYGAGSIETLIHLVDRQGGLTIVPRLAVEMMKPAQKRKLRIFAEPKPVREISLVAIKDYPRARLLELLNKAIIDALPADKELKRKKVLEI
ncbi:MAG TPA: LysR substrate-binding domain-containing protein, partial [Cyclobacteriaceae bacterium]|nr:LysR substrate-binding domain-containing protein [Cyclobacteriaceae bacterium]